jgi:hypothetical protein
LKTFSLLTTTLSVLLVCSGLFVGTASFAASLKPFSLTYDAKSGKKSLGLLEVSLVAEGDTYTLTTITKPGKMAQMLGGSESSETVSFTNSENGWALEGFHQIRRGRKAGETTVTKSSDQYAISTNGGKPYEISNKIVVEPTTYPIAPLTTSAAGLDGVDVMIIRRAGFRAHRYEYLGEEILTIAGKSYQTHKLRRAETQKTGRWYTIWVDIHSNHLVKMERNKKGRLSSIELIK